MMDERETDKLLGELFKRNAPYVDELALRERISDKLPRRRRRSRRTRTARAVVVGFASVVLIGGAAFGAYELVTYFQDQPALVITDLTLQPGDTGPSGTGTAGASSLAGLVPVMGTATLEQVKSQGTTGPAQDVKYLTQVRGQVLTFSLDMSQSGVSGSLEMTADLDVRADGSAEIRGSWILSNEQGIWECASWEGCLTTDGLEQFFFGQALGTGGFEGLTLYLLWHSTQTPSSTAPAVQPGVITGWIRSAD